MAHAYYNELNPFAAEWLRNLIAVGVIAKGDVDQRSIEDVTAGDLKGYTQCHFFAGIGGWPLSLRRAGWDDARPVWTGSCPCQSYSTVGAKRGREDERHLWPVWFQLISKLKPTIVFGEQVANAITYGWLDEVFYDLESEAYACAAAVLRACAVDSGHERRRLFFMALDQKHYDCGRPFKIQGEDELKALQGSEVGDAEFRYTDFMGKQFVICRDGYKRPALPAVDLLAHALPDQMAVEQAFGNAIDPVLGTEFIKTIM